MKLNFNEEKKQKLGFMHLMVDVIIFSRNESIFVFSRLRTTIGKINVHSILTKDI
jgi:hypothetical protein